MNHFKALVFAMNEAQFKYFKGVLTNIFIEKNLVNVSLEINRIHAPNQLRGINLSDPKYQIFFLDGWEAGYFGSLTELNWLFNRWGAKFNDLTKINLDNHLTDTYF